MRKNIVYIASLVLCLGLISCKESNTLDKVVSSVNKKGIEKKSTSTFIINDYDIMNSYGKYVEKYIKEKKITTQQEYQKQLKNKKCVVKLGEEGKVILTGASIYDEFKKAVLIIGKILQDDNAPNPMISPASAFVISEDGIAVTNHHIFKSLRIGSKEIYKTIVVRDYEGNVYPVLEVLSASKKDDLVIFRIDTKGKVLNYIPLGSDLEVGANVHLISHPNSNFYTYTRGYLSRTYIKRGTNNLRQTITADFAKGSSGAPIIDDYGNVIGIVAGTQNIYYGINRNSEYQMTLREIIPVSRLKEMIE